MSLVTGVVGYGSIGQRHARLLGEMGDIEVVISDPAVPDSLTFDELLRQRPHVVIVASPDRYHVWQTVAALETGAAVLLEKPICRMSAEAEPLAAHPCASRVVVGYVLRYSALFRKAKEIVAAGELGEIVSFQAMLGAYETLVVAHNRFAGAEDNALFFDYSHEWDYLAWFLGDIAEVAAAAHQSGTRPLTQNPNVIDAVLRLRSGATGTVHLDYMQSPGARRFSLIGDRASLEGDYTAATLRLCPYGGEAVSFDVREDRNVMYERQLRHLLDVASEAAPPLVTIDDAVQSVRVAEALIRAVQSGRWEHV